MTDLEITRLCAKATGHYSYAGNCHDPSYRPLHDDNQAMALVKKFRLLVTPIFNGRTGADWVVSSYLGDCAAEDITLNRACCKCVANMEAKKS